MKLETWTKFTGQGDVLFKKTVSDVNEDMDIVITVHSEFFKKSKTKQRQALRLFIWWAIKQYFNK